jgi:iron complex outermembrane receptor protein
LKSFKKIFGIIPIIAMLLIFLGNNQSFAQTTVSSQSGFDENTLEMIIVSATRLASKIMEIPANVTLITGEEVNEGNYSSISDAIKYETSVYFDENATDPIMIRGEGSEQVQILVNGVPSFNTFNSTANMDNIPLINIERIEILRGASSSLFGANAVAGVINITTREPETDSFTAKFGYGTDNTVYKGFDIYLRKDRFGIGFGYEGKSSDGYKQRYARIATYTNNPSYPVVTGVEIRPSNATGGLQYLGGFRGDRNYTKNNIWLSAKYEITPSLTAKYYFNYYNNDYGTRNPESFVHDANGNPMLTGSYQLPSGRYVNFTEEDFSDYLYRKEIVQHSLQLRETNYKFEMNIGFNDVLDDGYSSFNPMGVASTVGSLAQYPQRTINIDFQKEWDQFKRQRILTGGTLRQDYMYYAAKTLDDWKDVSTEGTLQFSAEGYTQTASAFVQDEIDIIDKFILYAGVRFDYFRVFDGKSDFFNRTPQIHTKYPSTSYTEFSPKVSLQYSPHDKISFYASYGHSFRPPELYQLYRTSTLYSSGYRYVGNPWLRPEKSDTVEFGIKSSFFDTIVEMSVFQSKKKDAIGTATYKPGDFPIVVDPSEDIRVYVNANKETRRGYELSIKRQFGEYVRAFANMSWQKGSNDYTDAMLTGIPGKLFSAGIDFKYKTFDLSVAGRYIGKRGNRNNPTGIYNLSYDPQTLIDANVSLRLFDHYTVSVAAKNILDKQYYGTYIYPGRTIMGTLTFEF